MITKTKEVFYCEHCNKSSLFKGSMTRHEKFCSNNPANKHACLECKHLERVKVEVNFLAYGEIPTTKTVEKYRCSAIDKMLHSFKAVGIGLLRKYPHQFIDSELMPNRCEHFIQQSENIHIDADTFL